MKKLLVTIIVMLGFYFVTSPMNANAESESPPNIGSEAAVMMEATTGTILYENNAKTPMYPASLPKIATAIYAIETADLNEDVKVSDTARNVEGTRVYLEPGEEVKLKKLIQGLLINSGNDAGVAIAEHLSGTISRFSEDLNEYLAEKVGVENTHFTNPHGLFNPDHVTTAKDLAIITEYALRNEVFKEIFGTRQLEWHGESWETTIYAHHKLFSEDPYEGITGGKTGFVDQSGFTLATTAKRGDLRLIVITLNSDSQSLAYNDTKRLLDYGFETFQNFHISKGETFDVKDTKYQTEEEVVITHAKNNQLNTNVVPGGTLEITDSDGTINASYSLVEMEEKVKETTGNMNKNLNDKDKADQVKTVEKSSMFSGYVWIVVVFILAVLVAGSFYHFKGKGNKNQE